ncbi:MAG: 16S rRNA (cytosine(1402)-N(4))-methyltransferase RsmH [Verrucomicrobia bacterium]|nr:16S rRNA (cytosine(1402)-N(4))-methyltransferase RsmH [Verrucomicrobiota bacterium]
MARAAFHGWLAARPSAGLLAGRRRQIGTIASTAVHDPVSRTVSGCSVREPAWLSSPESGETFYHLPVMPDEVLQALTAGPDRVIIDGTLGGGGHSELLLETGARVIGIDRDPEALAHARQRLARFGDRFETWEGNFADVAEMPFVRDGGKADGLLLDLGVSSRQLDAAGRGFSFQREGPLDMRMGPASVLTAAVVVNTWPEADLAKIIRELGEEPQARRIAAAIADRRKSRPFSTTTDLADCIERAIGRRGRIHPATRAFQAIRMTVNDELGSLSRVLTAAPSVLKPGGRLAIITFHSLEDRKVKVHLRHHASQFIDDPGWPSPRPNPDWNFHLPSRKAILPTTGETARNPRSRSAKLRVAQLLDPAS